MVESLFIQLTALMLFWEVVTDVGVRTNRPADSCPLLLIAAYYHNTRSPITGGGFGVQGDNVLKFFRRLTRCSSPMSH